MYSDPDKLTLTYEQTLAAMRAIHRVPSGRHDEVRHLTLPVWQTLLCHAQKTAPSEKQFHRDTARAMRMRPRKEDDAPFKIFEAAPKEASAAGDPVAEAVAIVRNLDITDIDWTKEPGSDYERRIRIEYLVDAGVMGLLQLDLAVHKPASDLANALELLHSESRKQRVEKEQKRIREIRDRIDREERS